MDGQFLVRQIYEDEITYNIVGAAVKVLSKLLMDLFSKQRAPLNPFLSPGAYSGNKNKVHV